MVFRVWRRKKAVERYNRMVTSDKKTGAIISVLLKFIILTVFAVFTIFPFYWMVVSGLKSATEYSNPDGLASLIPHQTFWSNFTEIFKNPDFLRALGISTSVMFISVFTKIVITTMAGFGFAHYEFRFRKTLFFILLLTMMLPEEALMIGQFNVIVKLNFYGTISALFIPFMASVFTIFLTKSAFESIPQSIRKSAKIDGVNIVRYFSKVALPYITPTLITNMILSAIGSWNSFLWPSIATQGHDSLATLPILMMRYKMDTDILRDSPQLIMALSAIVSAPMIVLFLGFRKRILNGVGRTSGGTKGR